MLSRILCCSLLLAAPAVAGLEAQSASPPAAAAATAAPVIQVGDAIRIAVWRNPELSGEFEIAEDGTILHPLYRSVRVAGLSAGEVEAAVGRVLQRFESTPEFFVEPLFRISVGGEVRTPNIYSLPPSTTVAQAIAGAGGPTPQARVHRVRLLRNGQTVPIDLTRPHSEFAELRIRSGDQIVVDRQPSIWREQVLPLITTLGSLSSILTIVIRASGS
jgi:protein involved in polysaccharide export with SLBB domain